MHRLEVNVSTDKIIVEYRDIPLSYFLGWFHRMLIEQPNYKVRRTHFGNRYVYQLLIKMDDGVHLYVMYQNQQEGERACYSLRIESRPEHLDMFADHLEAFKQRASEVNFVSCDVAYDVPVPLTAVFVGSHDMRRKLTVYKGTRYFGLPTKRKRDGYCRVYDKKLELLERRGIQISNDLTRIEMVYRPEARVALIDIVHHPPTQNRHYFASVIDDWGELPAK